MHSVTLDSSGSPRKRTFSRGLSEDESLRSIIKEADSSSRRVTRSDSRAGTLKRRTDSQSEQDLFMGHTEMLELQTSYDEVVQELRGLEVERETLLFQVDVLQDTLESVEELLAEAQREAGQASSELEREKEAKRKLESMVNSLMQEVERLNEESNNKPSALADTHRSVDEEMAQGHQTKNDVTDLTSDERRATEEEVGQSDEADEEGSLLTKVRKMVITASGHIPSLSLHNPGSEDGVLLKPCGNGLEDGPDTNDSDSISAYEDACAETPELDRIFSGEADTMELPDDLESKEGALTNSCQLNDGVTEESKNPDQCVVC